jgi:hypothetical protein
VAPFDRETGPGNTTAKLGEWHSEQGMGPASEVPCRCSAWAPVVGTQPPPDPSCGERALSHAAVTRPASAVERRIVYVKRMVSPGRGAGSKR